MSCGSLIRNALLFWFILFAIAFANGALRELVLVPLIGPTALPVSGVTGILLMGVAIALFIRAAKPPFGAAFAIGALWLVLTLAAEMVLVVASGKPVRVVAEAFSSTAVADGDLFAPLVVFVALSPPLFSLLRRPLH
ncbi:hypothetical protein RHODGE_RHODGE_05015 [Rhodoplanes serenus]|uniref:Uncharacterized protein n=1 Tax=Rhodoplanes serenus TaxID=200615 RepID=A0A3S4B8A4_9BRAD|nr:hypothetical protein [Rhodoplanes serenus]VCU11535.1 hypothetical protein RHODGE_RHODGE_05015 [Rhodoplanes serenus]